MNFGKNLNYYMEKKGINIPQLAELSGVTGAAISAYRRDLRDPHISKVYAISQALDISMDKLCGLKPKNESESELTSGERELLNLYRKLTNDKQRQMVRHLLKSYL